MKSKLRRWTTWLLALLMLCAPVLFQANEADVMEETVGKGPSFTALFSARAASAPAAEESAYAVLYADGEMTIQTDDTTEGRREVTEIYPLNLTGYDNAEDIPWCETRASIKKVSFIDTVRPRSVAYWFSGCEELLTLSGIERLLLDQTTSMRDLFRGCEKLEGLELIVNNKSVWDTSNVQDMGGLFADCTALTELDLSTLDTRAVTNLEETFSGCSGLKKMGLTRWDVSNVTNLRGLFYNCNSLTEVDMGNWKTAQVDDMSEMFCGCESLKTILASDSFVTTSVTNSSHMFLDCIELEGEKGTAYDALNTDATYARIDEAGRPGYFSKGVFALLYGDGTLAIQSGNKSDGREVKEIYAVDMIDSYAMTGEQVPNVPWFSARESIKKADFVDRISPASASLWFYKCVNLERVDHCENLDLSRATSMMDMLYGCHSLTSVDVSTWDTSNIVEAHGVFCECKELTSLDVSGWDTSNMTDMSGMFSNCEKLNDLDVSGFDTTNVTHFGSMFLNDAALEELDVSNWETRNVLRFDHMFDGCSSLTELDLSKWDTSSGFHFAGMFAGATNLETIWASERFVVDEAAIQAGLDMTPPVDRGADVFLGCRAIVGGNGTTYDSEHVDYSYLRIDTEKQPGYLSLKGLQLSDEYPETQANVPIERNALAGLTELKVKLDCTDPDSTVVVFIAAFYDESGNMLKALLSRQTVQPGTKTVTIPAAGVSGEVTELKLFALNTEFVPLTNSRVFALE